MNTDLLKTESPATKTFLTIPEAAERAGFSARHFRRIIENERIPVIQIRQKFFILGRDFQSWKSRNSPEHLR
jgi:excisionase family DNA binding protein